MTHFLKKWQKNILQSQNFVELMHHQCSFTSDMQKYTTAREEKLFYRGRKKLIQHTEQAITHHHKDLLYFGCNIRNCWFLQVNAYDSTQCFPKKKKQVVKRCIDNYFNFNKSYYLNKRNCHSITKCHKDVELKFYPIFYKTFNIQFSPYLYNVNNDSIYILIKINQF